MKQSHTNLPEIKLMGLKLRTSNKNESNWETGKIFPCIQQYFQQAIAKKIVSRKNPGTTYCVYAEYESDCNGEYTYFIGEEVNSFDEVPDDLTILTIQAQNYTKFTNGPGAMPDVVKEPWYKIWNMTPEELGGKRAYHADFEIYDERASDHQNVILDIYIGVS